MNKNLWTSNGSSVILGKELGRGGEGSVFELSGEARQVAKLYHELPTAPKQDKLRFMVAHGEKDLLSYCAWPTETLHAARGGPVVGFLMDKVAQKKPVHMVYGPAHRKQEYPKAAWDFLLYVARNTAAAFEVIHRHGHVLGDVNQGNVLAGLNSKVLLIDSDSMQISTGQRVHLCEVGVSHFTPPELQGISSFSTTARTSNHDAFGLALLIFHLLFGGRHPFAGRPLRDEVGNALETDIKAFRFAYGPDAANRGFAPPPRSIDLSLVPPSTQAMFQRAFTEPGAANGRPRASDWVAELDRVRSTLKTCGQSKMHVYPNHVTSCPWCALERAGTHFFIDLGELVAASGSTFVLVKVWSAIESVRPPVAPPIPAIASAAVTAKPLPAGVKKSRGRLGWFIVLASVAVVLIDLAPAFGLLSALLCVGVWLTVSGAESEAYKAEMERRQVRRDAAQKAYDQLLATIGQATSSEKFDREKRALAATRQTYMALPTAEKNMLSTITEKARDRQLTAHLEKFFIEDVSISGLGTAKKAALRSFGIETAADVSAGAVGSVRGFGPKLTGLMTTWRRQCESEFRFDSSPHAIKVDIARVTHEIAVQRQKLEALLQGGLERLVRLKVEADSALARSAAALQPAAVELAQAIADMTP